ncbi:MAG TPA: Crp/Fnr family transcriptional regulator [Roseiflexaceae bacterium]|nr:Crp/Fnr family transcriptional regulator [Roseiflexaceae bacterium]
MTSPSNDKLAAQAGYTIAGEDIFRDLSAAQRTALERQISYVTYPSGHIFFVPEEYTDRLLVLRSGQVRIYKLSPEGRALTMLVLQPPAIFGEMMLVDDWVQDSFAEAMSDCVVGALGRDDLREVLATYPAVALRFMAVMSQRLRALERKLADVAFKSVPQRLAALLLNLAAIVPADANPDEPLAVVRYTHQQLAEMVGSYRETITKTIGEFREAGLIRVEEDSIQLTDMARLQELAGR